MHTMNNNVKQCMNIMKPTLNTYSLRHKGPTSKENHQKKLIPYKNLIKNKLSQPRVQNSPKLNLRIKINEKSL